MGNYNQKMSPQMSGFLPSNVLGFMNLSPVVITPSELLTQNIMKLSQASSLYDKERNAPGYDETRDDITADIQKNLDDGADVHYRGHSSYDNFQLAYVLNQDKVTEMMIPHVQKQPPYYNIPCYPFLVHSYMYRGDGNVFNNSRDNGLPFSINRNIHKKYLQIATEAEKKDLQDYIDGVGKYSPGTTPQAYFERQCADKSSIDDDCEYIQMAMNRGLFTPPEFQ